MLTTPTGNDSRFTKAIVVLLFALGCPRLSEAGAVMLAWDPPSDGITIGYILFYGSSPQSYSQQVDISFATSYAVNNLSDGTTYYFALCAYDALGVVSDLSNEVSATVPPISPLPPIVTWLELAATVPPAQVVGTTVTWRSTARGGVQPYEFQWALYQANQWTVWPWTTASTWVWTPSTPGKDYLVRVAVRSSGSASTTGELAQSVPFTVTAPASNVMLSTSGLTVKGVKRANLTWSGASGSDVDVYRNRTKITTTTNDGAHTDNIGTKGSGTYAYKVCVAGTATCSNDSTVVF